MNDDFKSFNTKPVGFKYQNRSFLNIFEWKQKSYNWPSQNHLKVEYDNNLDTVLKYASVVD